MKEYEGRGGNCSSPPLLQKKLTSTSPALLGLNQKLTEELHKPVIRKLKKRKVHSSFIDNTSCRYATRN